MYTFMMPDGGEGTHESKILTWHVQEGDLVNEFDTLFDMESDKAIVDVSSPVTGVIAAIHVAAGETGIVGQPVCDIDTGETPTPTPPTSAPAADTDTSTDLRQLAVPRVRVAARRAGVDLREVPATGTGGKVTMEDLEAFLAADSHPTPEPQPQPQPQPQPEPASADVVRQPLSSLKKAANRAMLASYQQVPHVTIMDRVDCTALVAHRTMLKPIAEQRGVKLTYTAYTVKAAVAMLKKYPQLNARVDDTAEELLLLNRIGVGVAVDTDAGLVVPVIRDADRLSLVDVAAAIGQYAEVARAGRLGREDMQGGSMTITNVGGFATGGVWSTPIIHGGESVIVGIGRIEEEFVPDENRQPVLAPMMKISFTFDHRVVDGVIAQRALNEFKAMLADPAIMLALS